jgi:hypothetical protein
MVTFRRHVALGRRSAASVGWASRTRLPPNSNLGRLISGSRGGPAFARRLTDAAGLALGPGLSPVAVRSAVTAIGAPCGAQIACPI